MKKKNTTEEMIEVLQAFQQGKPIEYLYINRDANEDWNDDPDPKFNFEEFLYRVKKEQKSMPYDGTHKLCLVGKIVKLKNSSETALITGEDKEDLFNFSVHVNGEWISYKDLFNNYEFIDGKPCGTLKL